MKDNALFISYCKKDMEDTNWLERLKLYLAPLRRNEQVDIWDDSRIEVGSEWRAQIQEALDCATAAILLIGPGFMASDFIASQEVPKLLSAAKSRGVIIYPVVIGYCRYKRSILEPLQAFNNPDVPLEALSMAEQNKILNDICIAVDENMRHAVHTSEDDRESFMDITSIMKKISKFLKNTRTAFIAQCRRRDELVNMMIKRLGIKEMIEYENFFFRYYGKLNDEERFQFEQIRAMTEGPLYESNGELLKIIEAHPEVLDELPVLGDLKQHLVFWLNKYDRVFVKHSEMCLLYTGVEDGVPFPPNLNKEVDRWLNLYS